MSQDTYEDQCAMCRPILINPKTGKVMAQDSLEMAAINKVWEATTREERQAFHNVCCNNSRSDTDMILCNGLIDKIQTALRTEVLN